MSYLGGQGIGLDAADGGDLQREAICGYYVVRSSSAPRWAGFLEMGFEMAELCTSALTTARGLRDDGR